MSKKDGTKNCKCGETNLDMFAPSQWTQCKKCRSVSRCYNSMYNKYLEMYVLRYATIEEAEKVLKDDIKISSDQNLKKLAQLKSKHDIIINVREIADTVNQKELKKKKIERQKAKLVALNFKKPNKCKCIRSAEKMCIVCGETNFAKFKKLLVHICSSCQSEKRAREIQNIVFALNGDFETNIKSILNQRNKMILDTNKQIRDIKALTIAEKKIKQGNKGDDYMFYVLHFQSQIDLAASCFKYGITQYDITRRFRNITKFNITTIKLYYGSEKFIKAVERKVLLMTNKYRYDWPSHIYYDNSNENREFRTEIDLDLVESVIEEHNIILERDYNQEHPTDLLF